MFVDALPDETANEDQFACNPAHWFDGVLGDAAEDPRVDGADGPTGQHVDMGHRRSFPTIACYPPDPG